MRKLTNDEFIERVKKIHTNYDFSKFLYNKTHNKGIVICSIHGDFESRPSDLLRGRGCPKCGGSKKLTTEEFIEKVKKIHPNYDFKKFNYINNHTKGIVICPIHGEFESLPHNLMHNKRGCSKCNGGIKSNIYEFIEKVKKIHPNYNFNEFEYMNWKTRSIVICPIHGCFKSTPNILLNGCGCPKCGKVHKPTTKEFIEKIEIIHKKYDFSKFIYNRSDKKGIVICPIHGEFLASPNNLFRGNGCPRCRESKGEKFIAKWLQEHNIEYTPQKRFPSCKNKRELPFDFHIKNTNILIEYDGEQHFKPTSIWGGEKEFKNITLRDTIKNTWAKENKYLIIRLNYKMKEKEKYDLLENIIIKGLI
jgi:hypothetical protein